MGDISFAQIPNNWLVPFVWCEFNSDNAVSGASVQPMKMLVVGQKLSDGSAPALTVKRVTSVEQGRALFGKGSMLARMIGDVKNANKVTDLYAIAVDDAASGSAATATVTITGTAGESGTLCLYVGDYRIPIGVSKSNAAADIAQALAAAVSADGELPVTAACEAGVVTLTAKHKGECGNMPVHLNHYDGETLPAGLTVAVTDLTGGATNPDIGDVIAAIGDAHYNFIATPYTDAANLSALKTELESRWSALRAIEGVAFGALGGELSALGGKGRRFERQAPYASERARVEKSAVRRCGLLHGDGCAVCVKRPRRAVPLCSERHHDGIGGRTVHGRGKESAVARRHFHFHPIR